MTPNVKSATNAEALFEVLRSMPGCSQRMFYSKNKEGSKEPFSFCGLELVNAEGSPLIVLQLQEGEVLSHEEACGAMIEYMAASEGKSDLTRAGGIAARSLRRNALVEKTGLAP